MTHSAPLENLDDIVSHYQCAFASDRQVHPLGAPDVLMNVFGVTPEMKAAASQYWGRELGMCWERLVRSLILQHGPKAGPALTGPDGGSPCDVTLGNMAIDTKYRLGSGDSGTLKKLAANAKWLAAQGYEPVMLFLRADSLEAARTRMRRAGWKVLEGEDSFEFVRRHTGQDLKSALLIRTAS